MKYFLKTIILTLPGEGAVRLGQSPGLLLLLLEVEGDEVGVGPAVPGGVEVAVDGVDAVRGLVVEDAVVRGSVEEGEVHTAQLRTEYPLFSLLFDVEETTARISEVSTI